MNDGWVKLYRMLKDWEWSDNPNMVALWVHLLLDANFEEKHWHGITIGRGQLVTSLASLSEIVGISIQQVRTGLSRLEKSGEITNCSTNKYRIITICKFELYQSEDLPFNKLENNQTTINQQTNNNQITTPKERKKERTKEIYNISQSKDCVWVSQFFNAEMEKAMAVIPKVRTISESSKRAGAVRARIREHGIDAVREMIRRAAQSDFLNGKNQRGWTASFDWLFLPTNFVKVLEGNYDNHGTANNNQRFIDPRQSEREQLARNYAATIAQLAEEDDRRAQGVR